MALQKSIMSPYGVPATYWRIIRSEVAYGQSTAYLLGGYVNETVRRENYQPLMTISQTLNVVDKPRSEVYPLLKQSRLEPNEMGSVVETNPFAGSTDLLEPDQD